MVDLRKKTDIGTVIRNNAVTIMFVLLCIVCLYFSGLTVPYVMYELFGRLSRNAFIVLALILPIVAGMGINFAVTIGAMAAQIAALWVIEWGISGLGGFLLAMAEHYPETRFLGVERLLGRIRKVCNESARRGLGNVRGLRVESRYFLEWMVAPGSISRLHYLFPDPWPKEKHHKNRLVQDSFIPVLHRALAPGGEVLFKTDHEEYFQWVCERMDASPLFRREEWNAPFYPKTDFQKQWEAMGKPIFSARYVKNDEL